MADYKERLTAPTESDRNYLHYTKGGTNYAMLVKGNSVLPNCVGYAWGRWSELLGRFHELSRADAENWWGKQDGYVRSQSPKLGAVICWRKGKAGFKGDGLGHVAIVERINADGSILTSNSAYNGRRFYNETLKPPYALGGTFVLQGFIHLPVNYTAPVITKPVVGTKTNEQLAVEVRRGAWGNGSDRVNRLTSAGYNAKAIQDIVDGSKAKPVEPTKPVLKSNDVVAKEVLRGEWGNGADRVNRLKTAGYDPVAVQNAVNRAKAPTLKSNDAIAAEVISGKWGNGADRVNRLKASGYNPTLIQQAVNKRLSK